MEGLKKSYRRVVRGKEEYDEPLLHTSEDDEELGTQDVEDIVSAQPDTEFIRAQMRRRAQNLSSPAIGSKDSLTVGSGRDHHPFNPYYYPQGFIDRADPPFAPAAIPGRFHSPSKTPPYSTPSVSHRTRGDYSVHFGHSPTSSPKTLKKKKKELEKRAKDLNRLLKAIHYFEGQETESEEEPPTNEGDALAKEERRKAFKRRTSLGKQKVKGITEDTEPQEEKIYDILSAKTALVMDFSYDNPSVDAQRWASTLLERYIVDPKTGDKVPLWAVSEKPPHEVAELTPRFRMRCGYVDPHREQAGPNPRCVSTAHHLEIWRCKMLKLTKAAKRILFPLNRARLWALCGDEQMERDITDDGGPSNKYDKIACDLCINSVKLIICPLSGALLVMKLCWAVPPESDDKGLSERNHVKTLDDLRTWLFLAQFREEVENVTQGWTFPLSESVMGSVDEDDMINSAENPFMEEHLASLGRLSSAIYEQKPLPMGSIGNWLVHLPNENHFFPPLRINRGQRCHHHTVVVINQKPEKKTLDEYIHDLRRAQGQVNKPKFKKSRKNGTKGPDKVLIERANRYIGIAAEGVICITWPANEANRSYCVNIWPRQFLGIYLVLAVQVHAERVVLHELFNMSSELADDLDIDNRLTLPDMEIYRQNLRSLATRMIQYTVSMSSDDCGGRPEYSHFFYNLRKVFRIHKAKKEVREIIDDVLGIVDAGYAEEQKKTKSYEQKVEKDRQMERKTETSQRERKRRVYELLISSTAAISLPLVVVTGIFGMNFKDLPDPGFWPVFWTASGVSALLLVLLVIIYSTCISSPRHLFGRTTTPTTTNNNSNNTSNGNNNNGHTQAPVLIIGGSSSQSTKSPPTSRSSMYKRAPLVRHY